MLPLPHHHHHRVPGTKEVNSELTSGLSGFSHTVRKTLTLNNGWHKESLPPPGEAEPGSHLKPPQRSLTTAPRGLTGRRA